MKDQSIFGETFCGQPVTTISAGARIQRGTLSQGVFGANLLPETQARCQRPGIGPDGLPRSLS